MFLILGGAKISNLEILIELFGIVRGVSRPLSLTLPTSLSLSLSLSLTLSLSLSLSHDIRFVMIFSYQAMTPIDFWGRRV